MTLSDGGELTLDWFSEEKSEATTPTVVMVPGLSGGSAAVYIRQLISCYKRKGYRCVVMNFRGTNGAVLRVSIFFYSLFFNSCFLVE